ncbi:hypothetical protein [Actinoallomurus iriomotensis]|uniref:Integral membrane protein n=1 Tax=Actinoallomurus iriomotensis TaxID=478107 RepID=A0A9W6VUM5_9ACTN|nr:hypothetical protein [Actinoallomurus iriomotensis]GLY78831.1 hypothetical protein Airi01_070980 [Actinoallomurus iriomotensis]
MNPRDRYGRHLTHPGLPLILVATLYAAAQVVAVTTRIGLGWDESVYVSQVSPHVPTAFFSAPRARGITLLVAPIVGLTSSLTGLRLYMTVLSSAGLVVAYWPWTRLLRPVTVALAALLLTVLWVTQFYGNEVMPNVYVAYGAVAAVGWFAHTIRGTNRLAPVWLVLSLAFVALMRPGDAAWLVLPLLGAVAFAPRRRRIALAAVVAGPVAGSAQWIVEAYTRFGGPLKRLRASSRTEGGLGWHPEGVRMELHALNDRLLCRPCTGATWHVAPFAAWWPLMPALAAAGLVLAARGGRGRLVALPAVCGAVIGVSYLLLVGYAAPRFLIPAYALLAIPAAELVRGAATLGQGRWRLVTAGLVAVGLAVHAGGQQIVLGRMVRTQHKARQDYGVIAGELRGLGVRAPCTLAGEQAPVLAFYAGCRSMQIAGNDASTSVSGLLAQADVTRLAVVEHTNPRPRYTRGWHHYTFSTPTGRTWRVFLPPRPPAAPRS